MTAAVSKEPSRTIPPTASRVVKLSGPDGGDTIDVVNFDAAYVNSCPGVFDRQVDLRVDIVDDAIKRRASVASPGFSHVVSVEFEKVVVLAEGSNVDVNKPSRVLNIDLRGVEQP